MTYYYAVKETDRDGRQYALYGPFALHVDAETFASKMQKKAREHREWHRFVPVSLECPKQALEA